MSKTHVIEDFHAISEGLKNPNLKQSLYDEGSMIMKDVLLTLHGEAHRKRRLLELRVFRKNFFDWYEKTIFPETLNSTISQDIQRGRSELVDLGYRVTMNLTADFAGIDRPEKSGEETNKLLKMVETFSEGATIVHSTRPKTEVIEELKEAMSEFKPRFLDPSVARRQILIEKFNHGQISEEELPRDVLTVILLRGDDEEFTDEMLTREIAFYLQAGAHSTANSTIHAFHEISTWANRDESRWLKLKDDPIFLQRAVHESFRLHPASPVASRSAICPINLNCIGDVGAGNKVEFRLAVANRDKQIFGKDADDFNPEREINGSIPPFGLTFGTGVHACLGRELDGGALPRENVDPSRHQYGIVVLFLQRLFALGATLSPDEKPLKATNTERPNWGYYPIIFTKE